MKSNIDPVEVPTLSAWTAVGSGLGRVTACTDKTGLDQTAGTPAIKKATQATQQSAAADAH